MSGTDVQIELHDVHKRFGAVPAASNVNLEVRQGEMFALLGPSGCGKTTILRMIAGFEDPSEGTVRLAGRDMQGVPVEDREIGIVFQNYALFPHMTAWENIAFGLKVRKQNATEIREGVEAMLQLVDLQGLGGRRPGQLSGGQQQRVALARALAIRPKLLLLDEPLGALDRKLRETMQIKLVELQRHLGVTAIFVTHDQEEALTMADRIAVMSAETNSIEQIGTPREIYDQPTSIHVSNFIGRANLWDDNIVDVNTEGFGRTIRGHHANLLRGAKIGRTTLSIRPERIRISVKGEGADSDGHNTVQGKVRNAIFAGGMTIYLVDSDIGETFEVHQMNSGNILPIEPGTSVVLTWPPQSMLALPEH